MRLLLVEKQCILVLLLVVIPAVINISASGQGKQPPVSPQFTGVTVNPSTGNVDMTWSSSPSPDITGYIVYKYDTIKKEGYYIDTLYNPAATSFSVFRPRTAVESESYVIAAFSIISGDTLTSTLSNTLSTIFNKVLIDSCSNTINMTWNKYSSFPYRVTGYDILVSENGGVFQPAGHVEPGIRSFVIDTFNNGSKYCYLIRADLENSQQSSSSKSCLTARIQVPPQWINADYATVTSDGAIALSFTIDPSAETDLFKLERKTGAGTFSQIAIIRTGVGSITFTDRDAKTTNSNSYRLTALTQCNLAVDTSNIASNMVLTNQAVNDNIELRWTRYRSWQGEVSGYRLLMDTGNGFNEYAEIQPSDSTFIIPMSVIISLVTTGDACFIVTATEASNPHGITGESSSNRTCYEINEEITVPNLFTPDGDLKNDLFRPVLTFTAVDYHLVINDRQGRIVFDTRSYAESWDGTDNGSPLPQGVYIWSLRVKTLTGKNISRTGTITIFRNR